MYKTLLSNRIEDIITLVVGVPIKDANYHDRIMLYIDGKYCMHQYAFYSVKYYDCVTLKLY